jgi:hypothetical protein
MTPQNKKIAMYVGGAVVVGAIGFFVYSFFQKPVTISKTTVALTNDEEEPTRPNFNANNPFTTLLIKGVPPLKLPTYAWEQKI